MQELLITQAKPNPRGKDRSRGNTPNDKLVGEWIDVKNVSSANLNLTGVRLYDYTFGSFCLALNKREVYRFPEFVLGKNQTVRIHSGNEPVRLEFIDSSGADYHAYTGYDYVWNNVCGDIAELTTSKGVLLDKTSYDRNPLEGRILKRIGSKLI